VNQQGRDILQMLAEGKITSDEAERLLAALDRDQPGPASPGGDAVVKSVPKYLRVVVDLAENNPDGPGRVNVRVPLQLLRAGVRLASLIPPRALDQASDELRKSGVPFDLSQLKPEDLEGLIEHLNELTVEVDQPDVKVHVYCE
jgi:hypothetical protein